MCNITLINFKHFFRFFLFFHSLNRYLIIRQIAIKSYKKEKNLYTNTENIFSISLLSFRFWSNNNDDDDDRKQHQASITISIGFAFSILFEAENSFRSECMKN